MLGQKLWKVISKRVLWLCAPKVLFVLAKRADRLRVVIVRKLIVGGAEKERWTRDRSGREGWK